MPVVGAYSDHAGRRPLFLASAAIGVAELTLIALAPTLHIIMLMRVLGGLTNGVFTMSFAAIADASRLGASATEGDGGDGRLAKNFGMVGACFGIAFVMGPLVGGIFGSINVAIPCWVAAALMAADLAVIAFWWEETLLHRDRRPFAWRNANPLPALRVLLHRPELTSLVPPFFVAQLAHSVVFIWFIYSHSRYNWGQAEVGAFISCVGIAIAVVQGCLIGRIVPRVLPEAVAVLGGYACHAAAFTAYGFANAPTFLYAIVAFDALSSIADPSMQALMVRYVDPDLFGSLQGATDSLRTLAVAVGSPCFSMLLALTAPATDAVAAAVGTAGGAGRAGAIEGEAAAAAAAASAGLPGGGGSLALGTPFFVASALYGCATLLAADAFRRHPEHGFAGGTAAEGEAVELLSAGNRTGSNGSIQAAAGDGGGEDSTKPLVASGDHP
ncbi:unnamed protein product [Phaeothamnion confervicola]